MHDLRRLWKEAVLTYFKVIPWNAQGTEGKLNLTHAKVQVFMAMKILPSRWRWQNPLKH